MKWKTGRFFFRMTNGRNVSAKELLRIEERVVKDREIFRLTKLKYVFKECIEEKEGIKIPSCKTESLKRRLQHLYPFLRFV